MSPAAGIALFLAQVALAWALAAVVAGLLLAGAHLILSLMERIPPCC